MSEEEKVVMPATPPASRQQDPRRVEAGKKLAALSKAAKEKKARERVIAEMREESGYNWYWAAGLALAVVAVVMVTTTGKGEAPTTTSVPKQITPTTANEEGSLAAKESSTPRGSPTAGFDTLGLAALSYSS